MVSRLDSVGKPFKENCAMDDKLISCILCDWAGKGEDAIWHDLSGFDDDTMCGNQEGSGWYECPECGEVCQVLK